MRNRENFKDTENNWLLQREGNNGQDTETGRRVPDWRESASQLRPLLFLTPLWADCSHPIQHNDQKSKFKIQFLLCVAFVPS